MTRRGADAKGRAGARPSGAEAARELRRLSAVVRLLDTVEEAALAEAVSRDAVELTAAGYALLFLARPGERQLQLRGSTLREDHAVRRALEESCLGDPAGPLARREAGPFTEGELRTLFAGEIPPGLPPGALAAVPLFGDLFHAVLVIGREAGAGDLGEAAVREAIAFARAAAPHLRNVQILGRYRDLMIRDDQTRSFNRRYFDSFLEEEYIRASRYQAPLSLIFIDLDNLKGINEAHGHAMGSEAIRQTAERLIPLIRAVDKLFRYGGDEFCVVLPETPWKGAVEVAERLRKAMESLPILVDEIGGVGLTASFGVAAYPVHASTKEQLIRAADEAMYRIKQSGKNAVAVAGEIPATRRGRE